MAHTHPAPSYYQLVNSLKDSMDAIKKAIQRLDGISSKVNSSETIYDLKIELDAIALTVARAEAK